MGIKTEMAKIFKLQIPIIGAPMALVYNKNRSKEYTFPMTENLLGLAGDDVKLFVYGCYNDETNTFEIKSRAPWQDDWDEYA